MIMRKSNKKDGEPLTLDGLMSELNNLFASRKDDPKAMDIKSMIQSLLGEERDEKAEDDAMTACPDGIDISNEDLSGGMVGYDRFMDALNANTQIFVDDELGDKIPAIAFNHVLSGLL